MATENDKGIVNDYLVLIFQDMFRIGIAASTEPIWSSYISINEETSVKDYLYPGTYLNVIILHNRESFHFVLSSQKIGKIYIYILSANDLWCTTCPMYIYVLYHFYQVMEWKLRCGFYYKSW